MNGRVRLYLVGAVLLLGVGGCALPVDRPMAFQDPVATSPPRLAGVDRPPAIVRALDSFAAVENAPTGSIAPAARVPDAPAPFRRVQKHVYLLLGGLQGKDGWVTSAGMYRLRSSLAKLPDVTVTTYDWPSYKKVAADIALLPKDDIVVVIGYSGGGAKATWLANHAIQAANRFDGSLRSEPALGDASHRPERQTGPVLLQRHTRILRVGWRRSARS